MRKVVYLQETIGKPVDLPPIEDHDAEAYMLEVHDNYAKDGHKVNMRTWPNGNITIEVFSHVALICSYTIYKS